VRVAGLMTLSLGPPEKPAVKEVIPPPTELVFSCYKCRNSINESDAFKFEKEGEIFFACEDHNPEAAPAEPPKKDVYWTNVEQDLEKWRVEMVRANMEDKFYNILGAHGATNIQEVILQGDKEAVQKIFNELGAARYE
jgi:hypothetical protein